MSSENSAAGENVRCLEQGIELIWQLDDGLFADSPRPPQPGGVGAQFRHLLDFYDCFLDGLPEGRIDYAGRRRDARVESDREYAIGEMRRVVEALARLQPSQLDARVRVSSEGAADSPSGPEWNGSTARRELRFLLGHTVHHYALIALMLRMREVPLPEGLEGFGVAPATLRHWKASGSAAAR